MSLEPVITNDNAHAYHLGCPFLGVEDDPETKFLYATPEGYCHQAQPTEAVILAHQQTYCLTPQFVRCPVYCRQAPAPLPAKLRQPVEETYARSWLGATAVLLLLVGASLLWAVYGGGWDFVREQFGPILEPPATAVVIVPVTATATPTWLFTVTSTQTVFPSPTATASPATATLAATEIPLAPTATTTTAPATATVTPTPTLRLTATPVLLVQAIIAAERVNIRSGPSIDYPVLVVAEEGARFEVIGRLNGNSWWQICCTADGQSAWVFNEAVTIEGEADAVPVPDEILPLPTTSP